MARIGLFGAAAILLFAFSCGRDAPEIAVPEKSAAIRPQVGWDVSPNAERWTQAALVALDTHGAALPATIPADIDNYCPGYRTADREERKAFWVALLSALSRHESTWRPDVSGGGGRWHGLLQISPATARGYGCQAQTAAELKVGAANLACGLRIMSVTVPRDGVISAGMRGVAADWGPFHQSRKREDIKARTRAQPFCSK